MNKEDKQTYTIDASDQVLGRLAVRVANLLRGRHKADYLPYLDSENKVVVFNTDKLRISGKKMKQKIYYRHSLYPGGLKKASLEEVMERDSREIFKKAVYGMLPANKLRAKMMKRLKLHKGEASE